MLNAFHCLFLSFCFQLLLFLEFYISCYIIIIIIIIYYIIIAINILCKQQFGQMLNGANTFSFNSDV